MQFGLRIEVFLLLRHLHDIAQRAHRPGDNGDLLHRLGILLHRADQRVSDLVVGNDAPLLLAHDAVLFLFADKDLLHCLEEILLIDIFALMLDCVDSGLVDHIGQIGAHCSACSQRDLLEIH